MVKSRLGSVDALLCNVPGRRFHEHSSFRFLPLFNRISFFREPSTLFVRRYLERQDAAKGSTNHPFAGFSDPKAEDGAGAAPPQPPPGFQERTVRCEIVLFLYIESCVPYMVPISVPSTHPCTYGRTGRDCCCSPIYIQVGTSVFSTLLWCGAWL